jgi:hypothetical protein
LPAEGTVSQVLKKSDVAERCFRRLKGAEGGVATRMPGAKAPFVLSTFGMAEEGAEKIGLRAVKKKPWAEAHCKQGASVTTEVVP